MHGGWTSALALEVHGPRFSNACTDLQRMYPSLTAVVGRATPAPARLQALALTSVAGTPPLRRRWS